MGKIDQAIYQNYQLALKKGNVSQAKKAVELARYFKRLVEQAGFIDYKAKKIHYNYSFQKPITYKYYPTTRYLFINNYQISLTKSESSLFELFLANESSLDRILLVDDKMIKTHLWPNKNVSPQAIRVAIKRLKNKIEQDTSLPELFQNIYSKGYIFWAKRVY